MKHKLNTYLKTGILLFGIFVFVIACQKDDTISKEEQNTNVKTPIITTLSYEQTNETFNRLKDELKINPYLKQTRFSGLQARPTQDTLGLTIATDIIKQVTLGDYTSYTMEIVNETDSTVFFNLTIEYKNGESSMFVTKYTPTAYWLNNKNEVYQGDIQFREPATLTQWTDPNDIFEQDLGGGFDNPELGTGLGGTGGTYNADYPTNCFGTVIVTYELVPYPCSCEGHMPWQNCICDQEGGTLPGYDQVTLYTCEENWDIEDPYDPGDTGNSGGVSLPDPTDEPSISAMIKPEECIERLVGDIDGDCALSPYEWCLLGNNSQEICDCVAEGNTLAECIEEGERNRRCNQLQQIANNGNWTNRMQELRTATTGNTEILYYGNIGNDDNMNYSSGDRIEGDADVHGIPNHTISNPADSAIHNHFLGALPVFSPGDLYSLWTLFDNNLINDTDTFIMYLTTTGNSNATTDDDTLYAITISDVSQFQVNGALFLSDEDNIDAFFIDIGINPNISASLNEQRFLQLIKGRNLGLTLYKGDKDNFNNWSQLKLKNDDTIKTKNCN